MASLLLEWDLVVKRLALFTLVACLMPPGCHQSFAAPALKNFASNSPATKKGSPTKRTSSSRSYRYPQRAPTRDRYKQIQTALAERGYNPGPIDGRWGSRTSAALKRFEKDHNLPADGKLDSLALITLGLGPKRLSSVSSSTGASK